MDDPMQPEEKKPGYSFWGVVVIVAFVLGFLVSLT